MLWCRLSARRDQKTEGAPRLEVDDGQTGQADTRPKIEKFCTETRDMTYTQCATCIQGRTQYTEATNPTAQSPPFPVLPVRRRRCRRRRRRVGEGKKGGKSMAAMGCALQAPEMDSWFIWFLRVSVSRSSDGFRLHELYEAQMGWVVGKVRTWS